METNIRIALAVPEDAPAIRRIMLESFRQYCDTLGIETIEALEETVSDIEEDIRTKLVFTALINGGIVGSARVKLAADGSAYLSRFGTLRQYQELGVGTALFAAVDEEMRRRGVSYLELVTASGAARLVNFYSKLGYITVSHSGEAGYDRLLLRKYYDK